MWTAPGGFARRSASMAIEDARIGAERERTTTAAAIAGLVIAWGGTALLVSPVAPVLGDPAGLAAALVSQGLLWLLAVAVIASVLWWERRPLASLWLQPFRWHSIAWGLLLVVLYYAVLFPTGEWVRRAAGL